MHINYTAFTITRNQKGEPTGVAFLFPEAVLPDGTSPSIDVIRHSGKLNFAGLSLNIDLEGQEIEIPIQMDAQKEGTAETVSAIRKVIESSGKITFIENTLKPGTFEHNARKTDLAARYYDSDIAFMNALAEKWMQHSQAG